MLAADRAEAMGDAAAALSVIARHFEDDRGEPFWRPDRVRRLQQLTTLGSLLPSWATSRWILAQAAQTLAEETRVSHRHAIRQAVAHRGVTDENRGLQDRWNPADVATKVMDHDWVFRQLFLYDGGALRHFLRRVATPDLLVGADHIDEWAAAPMGGFRLVSQDGRSIEWHDLGTAQAVVTPNIGSAVTVLPGEHVIGRRVPILSGEMFESAPLLVPQRVAEQVANAPGGWAEAVAAQTAPGVPEEQRVMTGGHDFGLLTDVPLVISILMATSLGAQRSQERTTPDVGDDQVSLVRAVLDGQVWEAVDEVPAAPLVAASLIDPLVLAALADRLSPADVRRLRTYADQLPDPCPAVSQALAEELLKAS